ncbi:tetratricopeptide (TPR) repeat protein [Dysgonomonas sp. PH5-45]|uniref:tetratricopeptide repeat protein n=1 Tax=unclassified Dysgonomonas TaxID=2630389 RepID=UPI002473EAE8|nr:MULTISPECIES: tetratricopeptide repeat protein [unclassified Dysgonomonas]MDH6353996.1 tetratricopeptide (TPR) repeat protein [Dysgonomonas sp. PH5-45]MDH6386898.1 tetratricopeptide (TPR) repeat protein [Dysgonomonas sp. PH5-37]
MKKKFFLGICLSFFLATTVSFAQGSLGEDYFYTQEYAAAKNYFEKQADQSSPLTSYYLGDIALQEGKMAEAKTYFENGLAQNPKLGLNEVGLGKLLLKTDPKAAENHFDAAIKLNKKDKMVYLAIARAYFEAGMKPQALVKIAELRKLDKKYPYLYILEGDIWLSEGKEGEAATQYAQAMAFDSKCVPAYIKNALVYENTGISGNETAIEELNKVLETNPDYILAYKYLGRIYYDSGRYNEAIEAYKKFMAGGNYTVKDLTSYAGALYFTEQYDEASKIINEGLASIPDDFVLNRLAAYSALQKEDYAGGIKYSERFFAIPKNPKTKYISLDYITYGKLLAKSGQAESAVAQYKKAIELEPENRDLYLEVSEACAEAGLYAEAGDYYSKYINLLGEEVQALDYYNVGRNYYSAGAPKVRVLMTAQQDASVVVDQADVELGKELLNKAVAAFSKVAEMVPESHLGYFWRARATSALDPTTELGLAKDAYEETAKVILAKEGGNGSSDLKEAYEYLAVYYYKRFATNNKAEDKAQMKSYSEKLLTMDPENGLAKQLIEIAK